MQSSEYIVVPYIYIHWRKTNISFIPFYFDLIPIPHGADCFDWDSSINTNEIDIIHCDVFNVNRQNNYYQNFSVFRFIWKCIRFELIPKWKQSRGNEKTKKKKRERKQKWSKEEKTKPTTKRFLLSVSPLADEVLNHNLMHNLTLHIYLNYIILCYINVSLRSLIFNIVRRWKLIIFLLLLGVLISLNWWLLLRVFVRVALTFVGRFWWKI